MRMTSAQIAIHLICGETHPRVRHLSLQERIRDGHDLFVSITGHDFGYDLLAWHNHLKEFREGGYTFGRNIALPKVMQSALQSVEWQKAVQSLLQKQQTRPSTQRLEQADSDVSADE